MKNCFVIALFFCVGMRAESSALKLLPSESPRVVLLKEALMLALANNFELKKAVQTVEIAKSKSIAAASEVLPKVSLRGSRSHTLTRADHMLESPRAGLIAEIPLFDAKNLVSLKTAKESLDAESLSYAQKRDALLFDVSKLYAEAILAQSVREVAVKETALYSKQFTVFKTKAELGVIRNLDVFRAKYLWENAEAAMATKELDFQNKLAALGRALGKVDSFMIAPFQITSTAFEKDEKSLASMAHSSTHIQALKKKASSATYALMSERLNFLPKVSLTLDSGWQLPLATSSSDFSSKLMFNVELPLFQGGSRWASLKSAQANQIIHQVELEENLQTLQLKVSGLLESIKARQKALASAEAAKLSAQSASDSAERLFSFGEATGLEVIEASVNLVSASNSLLAATYELELSKLSLLFLVGKIAEIM